MIDESRMDRFERKLDQMGEAIVALARVEERMVTLFKRLDAASAEQALHAERITIVENKAGRNGQMLRFAERVFWIVVTATVSYAFTHMKGT